MLSLIQIPLHIAVVFTRGEKIPFQPLFKNIGEKPAFQKGWFSARLVFRKAGFQKGWFSERKAFRKAVFQPHFHRYSRIRPQVLGRHSTN
jgi:hypothetical protein